MRHHCQPIAAFIVLALLAAPAASAGALYRCQGKAGEVAYTSKPAGYHSCTRVASYADPPAKPAAETLAKASVSGTTGQWNYREQPAEANAPAADVATAADAAAPPAAGDQAAKDEVLRGAVYKVTKASGVVEYTNIRPAAGRSYRVLFTYISTCYACDVHSRINFASVPLNANAYREVIAAAAKEFGVDESLLRAVIHAESAFNPNALSVAGAQGLMQLMPDTAGDLGVANPFDATQNIRGGAQYLAGLLRNFSGNERLALAAYNAGPANVQKYGGVPPFEETRVYVDRVALLRERYRKTN